MRNIITLFMSMLIVGYSHADSENQKKREIEISKELITRTMSIADDISQSRKLYIAAYNTINSKSEMNNELFVYTVRKVENLIGTYEVDNDNFENDIKHNKKITLEAVDGLCIMNKFIQKYSIFIDLEKIPESLQKDTKKILKYQNLYIQRLNEDKDYLNQLKCLNLK